MAPIVALIRHRDPAVSMTVALVPCQYATGNEPAVAAAIPGVATVWSVRDTVRRVVTHWCRKKTQSGVVLCLGGDPIYAKCLGRQRGWPVLVYSEHDYALGWGLSTVFRKSQIGDLMAARVVQSQPSSCSKDIDIMFFLGSRPHHFALFAPFCLAVAAELKTKNPHLRIGVQRSPFITDLLWDTLQSDVHFTHVDVIGDTGIQSLARTRLMVSLPGTSTAEAMYMRTPMMVLVPLNRPDLIQFDGLFGLIGNAPFIGRAIKSVIVSRLARQRHFVALPNKLANRAIVPETVGVLTVGPVAQAIFNLINDESALRGQTEALSQFPVDDRAAVTIVDAVLRHLGSPC